MGDEEVEKRGDPPSPPMVPRSLEELHSVREQSRRCWQCSGFLGKQSSSPALFSEGRRRGGSSAVPPGGQAEPPHAIGAIFLGGRSTCSVREAGLRPQPGPPLYLCLQDARRVLALKWGR